MPDGDPDVEEANPNITADDHWSNASRPPWQRHSSLGPNINSDGKLMHFCSPREVVVNPPDATYSTNTYAVSSDAARATWEVVRDSTSQYSDASLRRDLLDDDFQQLFLDIVLRHVQELIASKQRRDPFQSNHCAYSCSEQQAQAKHLPCAPRCRKSHVYCSAASSRPSSSVSRHQLVAQLAISASALLRSTASSTTATFAGSSNSRNTALRNCRQLWRKLVYFS